MDVLWLLLGGGLLYVGGELLVGNAIKLARNLGLSPMIIGLTVVSLGTSAPELAASLAAVYSGAPDVAIGNVIGSNIANIGLILGAAAILRPMVTTARFIKREIPFLVAVSLFLCFVVWSGSVGRVEGVLLLCLLVLFLAYLLRYGDGESAEVEDEFAEEFDVAASPVWKAVLGTLLGVVTLVLGAEAFVEGAVGLARIFGVSERVIGLTLVAFGTSLPELASSLVAAARKQADIVVGNVVGSNIFNIVTVLGLTAVLKPFSFESAGLDLDLGVMIGFVGLAWVTLYTGLRVSRTEGIVMVLLYLTYIAVLFI